MSQEIMEKLNEHTQQFEHVNEQVDLIAQKVLEQDQKFEDITNTLSKHDSYLERITKKLIDHDERFDRIEDRLDDSATKDDVSKIMTTLDTIVGITNITRQELLFMGERVKRVEQKSEQNNNDLKKIKPLVGLT